MSELKISGQENMLTLGLPIIQPYTNTRKNEPNFVMSGPACGWSC